MTQFSTRDNIGFFSKINPSGRGTCVIPDSRLVYRHKPPLLISIAGEMPGTC